MADKYIMNMDRNMNSRPISFKNDIEGLQRGLLLEIEGMAKNDTWLDGVTDDFEAYKVKLASPTTAIRDLVVHTSVPNMYDERLTERDFALEKGKAGRGHYLTTGDEYTFSTDMVTGVSAVGEEVELASMGKLALKSTGTAVGEVVKIYTWNGQASVMIRFY